MLAVSNAARQDEWEGTAGGSVGVPASSTFETVADYALLYYACGDGTIASLTVPAPSYAIFLADGSTVDATNAGIVALNGDAIGALLSASGSAAVSFIGGRRQRNNRDY